MSDPLPPREMLSCEAKLWGGGMEGVRPSAEEHPVTALRLLPLRSGCACPRRRGPTEGLQRVCGRVHTLPCAAVRPLKRLRGSGFQGLARRKVLHEHVPVAVVGAVRPVAPSAAPPHAPRRHRGGPPAAAVPPPAREGRPQLPGRAGRGLEPLVAAVEGAGPHRPAAVAAAQPVLPAGRQRVDGRRPRVRDAEVLHLLPVGEGGLDEQLVEHPDDGLPAEAPVHVPVPPVDLRPPHPDQHPHRLQEAARGVVVQALGAQDRGVGLVPAARAGDDGPVVPAHLRHGHAEGLPAVAAVQHAVAGREVPVAGRLLHHPRAVVHARVRHHVVRVDEEEVQARVLRHQPRDRAADEGDVEGVLGPVAAEQQVLGPDAQLPAQALARGADVGGRVAVRHHHGVRHRRGHGAVGRPLRDRDADGGPAGAVEVVHPEDPQRRERDPQGVLRRRRGVVDGVGLLGVQQVAALAVDQVREAGPGVLLVRDGVPAERPELPLEAAPDLRAAGAVVPPVRDQPHHLVPEHVLQVVAVVEVGPLGPALVDVVGVHADLDPAVAPRALPGRRGGRLAEAAVGRLALTAQPEVARPGPGHLLRDGRAAPRRAVPQGVPRAHDPARPVGEVDAGPAAGHGVAPLLALEPAGHVELVVVVQVGYLPLGALEDEKQEDEEA